MTAGEALTAVAETLELLQRALPATKEGRDEDVVIRLAIERLWITAGHAADAYRRTAGVEAGIEAGIEPWAELIGYRNRLAHALHR